MATKNVAGTGAVYWAFNYGTGQRVPGDSANHTLYWAEDNGAPATITSPSITDNNDGSYSIALTAAQTNCGSGKISGTSSTMGVELYGVEQTFEDPATLVGALTTTQASGSFWQMVATQLGILFPGNPFYIINQASVIPTTGAIGPYLQGTAFTVVIPIPTTAWALSTLTPVFFSIGANPQVQGSGTQNLTLGGTVLNAGVPGAYPTGQAVSFSFTAAQSLNLYNNPITNQGTYVNGLYAYQWGVTATLAGNCTGIATGQMSISKAPNPTGVCMT